MSESTFTWGTVTALGPLRVKLDGDSAAIPVTPDCLVDPLTLAVSTRVRCELTNNRLVVHGVAGGATPEVPTGVIAQTALAAAPAGWLLCDGSAVSRTTYPLLFAAIGTTFGAGNGTTTFNVPNLKGRVIVGIDTGQAEFDVRGEVGGSKTHTLAASEMPVHSHATANNTGGFLRSGTSSQGNYNWVGTGASFGVDATTGNAGSGGAHNNLQPYAALHHIIKAA